MATAAELNAAVEARLKAGAPNVTTYVGEVASQPPAQPGTGKVYGYFVLWPSGGFSQREDSPVVVGPDGALDWSVQITVAAGEVGWLLKSVDRARQLLEGHILLPGVTLREQPSGPPVQPDRDVDPVRFYVPLLFRALTP